MKNSTIIIFITLTLLGCRVNRQKQEELSMQTREVKNLSQSSDRFLWQRIDSSQSYWRLHTDSLLFYHPEIGTWTKGGQLEGYNMRQMHSSWSRETDSINQRSKKEMHLDAKSYLKTRSTPNWSIAICLVIVVIIMIIWIRSDWRN